MRHFVGTIAGSLFLRRFTTVPAFAREDEYPVFRSEARLVLLDVSVKRRNGSPTKELSKENFIVSEDGAPQVITVFAHNDLPVTVGLLVDESRSMAPKRAEVVVAAEAFIRESNPQDEIFVLNFNDSVKPGLPEQMLFSDDIKQLRSALYHGIPEGKTALNDAVVAGLDQLRLGRRDKKTLIVISDGGDNASKHTRRDMIDRVERSIATIYTIGLFEPDDPERNPIILKQLAKITGGYAYFPDSPSQLAVICRSIAKDIRTRYTIGYLPKASNGKSSLRRISLRVSSPDHTKLIARTRISYRYD
jgi:VWFA-related protein